jgi:DNA-directed DNA polymerase III PolC
MILNAHSYYSLRYGVLSNEDLIQSAIANNYDAIAITDINNSAGVLEFVKLAFEKNIKPLVGMEFRHENELWFIAIAINNEGFKEINDLQTNYNIYQRTIERRPNFNNSFVIYPYGIPYSDLKENEYIGIKPSQLNKIKTDKKVLHQKYCILQSYTYNDYQGYEAHKKLRAVDENLLLSQLQKHHYAGTDEYIIPSKKLLQLFEDYPTIIHNTKYIIDNCHFKFDFKEIKNKRTYTGNAYDDKLLLEKLTYDGMKYRYGKKNKIALERISKELEIIDALGFSAYFLITWDIIRYSLGRGFYHVGRGSGANSVVAYCLRITDVCPIELDLYFERFLNPKRKSPPDFDIDYSWRERDEVHEYIFKRYGREHTALLGAMSTFKDRSILREMGKVYGLPKGDIDRLIEQPNSPLNNNAICHDILKHYNEIKDYPNVRTIHAGGVLVSELPLTYYCALDLPPKSLPTSQFDMYLAEDIGFEKLDILSQRGIGHIKDSAELVYKNKGIKVDIHDVNTFKNDKAIKAQLKTGDTIGCFYVESPAMRGLLKKLHCEDYLTLVAASSIIRPGVASSGMMKEYISRFHNQKNITYLHPIMEDQLKETFGVMVYQEDVLKVGHYFGGLDLADADVLRRMMSGKSRNIKHLEEITDKYFAHCEKVGHPLSVAKEVWRQIESFAGYSFSKAHSASYAVESFQSLHFKTYYPKEFMVAVINNFGGFYNTKVYVNEARKAGAIIHLPCVNNSNYLTTIKGDDVYLGFIHIEKLKQALVDTIEKEREQNGLFTSLENLMQRTGATLDQLKILIRIDALRFTQKSKRDLLWEAHLFYTKENTARNMKANNLALFNEPLEEWTFPAFEYNPIEDAYDEFEILGFTTTMSEFSLLQTKTRLPLRAKNLINHVGKTIRIMGIYVTRKMVRTKRGDIMAFGTFLDEDGDFFDTVNFPPSIEAYPFKGSGVYLIKGKVVQEFDFPSIEVQQMVKLPIMPDPREV